MNENSIGAKVVKWMKSPYNDNMNLGDWFLFVGMLGVLTFLWSRILRAIALNI